MTGKQAGKAIETWVVRKPAVQSTQGLVASQHYLASDIGARVLADGGNAVDAAVAAGLAIGAVEPWMSGLGGGGVMLIYVAAEQRVYTVDFSMRAPQALDPRDYPLVGGTDSDLFGWPAVLEQRNILGPQSFAVPGFVAGHALALARFGTRSWADSLAPAIALAENGMTVDWYATLKIAGAAPALARFPESACTYLPAGFVPAGQWMGPLPCVKLGNLGRTLKQLATAGPRDFYEGDIAHAIYADAAELGSKVSLQDLSGYRAAMMTVEATRYRGATVHAPPALTAGPTLQHALQLLAKRLTSHGAPDADAYGTYASCLREAYAERLVSLGDEPADIPSCTTHLGVVDAAGNMVALTQTLLSIFGSKVMLPKTGILMNNGIMWFDPRPGRPNSLGPGKRPLSNMCPVIVERKDGFRFAVGASGGRRIMPAVFQLISFLVDFGMSVDEACHCARIDVSGTPLVRIDDRLEPEITAYLSASHQVEVVPHGVYPAFFASPNIVGRAGVGGVSVGGAFVMSPWAKVSAAGREGL